jgi:tRNA A37 N6-isopentenylltransferase MiaA
MRKHVPVIPKVLAILGVTGIGKSRLALGCAHRLHGELVSVDSVKVYKGLDIGSHKVPITGVPVHMYDVIEPKDQCMVQRYVEMASTAMQNIIDRGKVPILFGGAGMYMEWLLFGPGKAIPVDRAKRDVVEAELRALGWEAAVNHAGPLDLSNVQANDYYRLAKKVTADRMGIDATNNNAGFCKPILNLDRRCLFVFPADRLALCRSIGE